MAASRGGGGEGYEEKDALRDAGIDTRVIMSDVINAVKDYCGDGFDAVEECLRTQLLASGDEADFRNVHECIEVLYSRLLAAVEDSFVRVEEVAKDRFFFVPEAHIPGGTNAAVRRDTAHATAAPATDKGDDADQDAVFVDAGEEEEKRLDEQLRSLRLRIAMANGVMTAAREESEALGAELSACAPALDSLRGASRAEKENRSVAEQVASLLNHLFGVLKRSENLQEDSMLLERWGRPGADTAQAQIQSHQERAGNVTANALQDLENMITS